MKENTDRINSTPAITGGCPNEGRLAKVEINCHQNGQDFTNFSLIFPGIHPNFQNGLISFVREILGVMIDPNEVSEILRLCVNRKGMTVTKAVFFSVSTKLRIYQARTALRGQSQGIFNNENLTEIRERLNYTACLLFKDKTIAKNWSFLGKIYIKHTLEGEVIELTKKKDLKKYDTNGILNKGGLLD